MNSINDMSGVPEPAARTIEEELRLTADAYREAAQESDAAWKASGVESVVRGVVTLAEVVGTIKKQRDEARAEAEWLKEVLESLGLKIGTLKAEADAALSSYYKD